MIFSSVYLSFAGVAMGYIACVVQGLPITWEVMAIMFLVTYAVYNIDRKADEEEDSINHSERYSFTSHYSKFLFISSIIAYLTAFSIASFYGAWAVIVTAIPLLSGLLYSFAWLPGNFRYRRLKEIPSVKNLVIAFAWAFTPALLPALINGTSYDITIIVTIAYFFLLVFINTVVFDMRDIEGDSLSGIDTIPVLLGAGKTRLLLIGMTVFFGFATLFLSISRLSVPAMFVLVAGIVYALAYVLSSDRLSGNNAICDVMADGQFIMLGCILFIVSGVFVG
jgi:4-hydroxybenzoate polyprenyltransferase